MRLAASWCWYKRPCLFIIIMLSNTIRWHGCPCHLRSCHDHCRSDRPVRRRTLACQRSNKVNGSAGKSRRRKPPFVYSRRRCAICCNWSLSDMALIRSCISGWRHCAPPILKISTCFGFVTDSYCYYPVSFIDRRFPALRPEKHKPAGITRARGRDLRFRVSSLLS